MAPEIDAPSETVVILNPQSGSADHRRAVRDRAAVLGYDVVETDHGGHAVDLARESAAASAEQVVAAGGDGTLNEVVRGVVDADGLDAVTVGVIPAGTGNDFAANVGVTDLDTAFDVLESGERRWLDVGMADDRPFVNSCVAGLTADASSETSDDLKSRIGVLAYAVATLRTAASFDAIDLTASVDPEGDGGETVWDGSAAIVLVGNGRRFAHAGSTQANVEDGLLDVTIVEEAPTESLLRERVTERLFREDGDHVTRLLASSLDLSLAADDPVSFSLDGEMSDFDSLSLSTRHRALRVPVGEDYDPTPTVD